MSSTEAELPWLTISEAAERTGRKIDAMRALVRRGRLPRRKGNKGEWLVQLPQTLTQAEQDSALDTISDNALDSDVTLLREQVTELRLTIARLEGELATVRAVGDVNVEASRRLLTERDAVIADLRLERERLLELVGTAQSALAARSQGFIAMLWDRWRRGVDQLASSYIKKGG